MDYRLYYINTASGRIDRAEELDEADDFGAISLGRSRIGDQALELWCRSRRVTSFAAIGDKALTLMQDPISAC